MDARYFARNLLNFFNEVLLRASYFHSSDSPKGNPDEPAFIIGVPRSGTTLLYQALTSALPVYYQPNFGNWLYGSPSLVARLQTIFCSGYSAGFDSRLGATRGWCGPSEHPGLWRLHFPWTETSSHRVTTIGQSATKARRLRLIAQDLNRLTGRTWLVKSLYLSMCLPALFTLWPNAKFIHITREREFCGQSLLKANREVRNRQNWFSVRPPGYEAMLHRPLLERVAWQTVICEGIIKSDLEAIPNENVMQLNYDQLCSKPRQIVRDISQWIRQETSIELLESRIPPKFDSSDVQTLDDREFHTLKDALERYAQAYH